MKWRGMRRLYAALGRFVNPVVGHADYCMALTRDECPLNDVIARLADVRRNLETALIEHRR